ncbi:MAG: sulfur carrier protein ThiS [Brevundimonas sp.]|jgi:sulfur carrier protein|uniref:sulfur carrier protein ThiS n=1 Tax=Brevundimonas sp. TaxID=1871086 RepID=UPI00391A72F4
MHIEVNGQSREVAAQDVAALVAELGLDARKVAIERNREIVPRSLYETIPVEDGDRFEIVQFVGGG